MFVSNVKTKMWFTPKCSSFQINSKTLILLRLNTGTVNNAPRKYCFFSLISWKRLHHLAKVFPKLLDFREQLLITCSEPDPGSDTGDSYDGAVDGVEEEESSKAGWRQNLFDFTKI